MVDKPEHIFIIIVITTSNQPNTRCRHRKVGRVDLLDNNLRERVALLRATAPRSAVRLRAGT